MAALSPDLIANYRDERLSEGKSPDTVRIELALLSHLYTIAIREWHLGLLYSPVANIRKPTPGRGRNRRLTPDEERRLLKACRALPNPTLGWLVRTALHTTMRAGELLTLQKDQVDLPRRIVRLEQTKNGSARTVPLSRAAVATLREALKHPARPEETSLVFPGEPGKDGQRRPYQFHCVWSRMLKRAGITGLRFHDLRYEAVSRLVEAGLSDQEVAAISGHRTMQMLKRYTHLRAEDLVARLDQAIPNTAPTRIRRRKGARAEASRAA